MIIGPQWLLSFCRKILFEIFFSIMSNAYIMAPGMHT